MSIIFSQVLLATRSHFSSAKVPTVPARAAMSMQARLSEQLHLGECFTLLYIIKY
jgi:hypothetical protein